MNKFQLASEIERLNMRIFFSKYKIEEFTLTDANGFSKYDGIFNTSKTQIIFETKVRKTTSTQYEEIYIDQAKYEYMLQVGKEMNRIPYVFFFFKDNKVLPVNLNKTTVRYGSQETNKHSVVDSYKENSDLVYIKINKNNLINHQTNYEI